MGKRIRTHFRPFICRGLPISDSRNKIPVANGHRDWMMVARKGEEEKTHFRTERLESINGQWFFRVREQKELMGPYSSREKAKKAAEDYIEDIKAGKNSANAISKQYMRKAFSLKD